MFTRVLPSGKRVFDSQSILVDHGSEIAAPDHDAVQKAVKTAVAAQRLDLRFLRIDRVGGHAALTLTVRTADPVRFAHDKNQRVFEIVRPLTRPLDGNPPLSEGTFVRVVDYPHNRLVLVSGYAVRLAAGVGWITPRYG